jgi:hypothetical protein
MLIIGAVIADLYDDALITPSGLAEFADVGHEAMGTIGAAVRAV